jgi:Mrp family chromosome partitioning ATPase
MSGLYEALKQAEMEQRGSGAAMPESANPAELFSTAMVGSVDLKAGGSVESQVVPTSRLVAVTEPRSIGAEKFRVLAARLENLRKQRELRSIQVTSSVEHEGKSLIAGNLAITFSQFPSSKVLLVEGDLHRPKLASLLGLKPLPGVGAWWSGQDDDVVPFLHKLSDMPLWFLGAGQPCDQPSNILQSSRFAQAFTKMAGTFDWIIVDSVPMQPTVDANLWSRLVDGTLLVVRESLAPIKALKKGLESLDNLKLVGIVLNEASEFAHGNYNRSYDIRRPEKKRL